MTRLEELGEHNDVIQAIAFQSDNLVIAAMKNGDISIWNHQRASLLKKI